MRIGASTFIWVSPFGNDTLDLITKVKDFGFDLIEICIEDPDTIDADAVRRALETNQLDVTTCGAFGPQRDMSSEDASVRAAAKLYTRRCIDLAASLGSKVLVGPMYAGVGNAKLMDAEGRRRQWNFAVEGLSELADHAAAQGIVLGIEPLNRFETDLVNTVEQGMGLIGDIARANVGLLLDTFHMNIEEKDIPAAIRRAGPHIVEFHACSSDRGTPGEDHLPWPEIASALEHAGYGRTARDRSLHAEDHRDRQGGVTLAPLGAKPGSPGAKWPSPSAPSVRLRKPWRRMGFCHLRQVFARAAPSRPNVQDRCGDAGSAGIRLRPTAAPSRLTYHPNAADSSAFPYSRTSHSGAAASWGRGIGRASHRL